MALSQAEINEVMQQLQPIIAKALNESTSIAQAQANIRQGVIQYTGARYVPLFADPIEWDNKRAFDPLTIVLYQGNSFTTRQYTPTGIDISNEEFWVETGNYNAQIEAYRNEVKAVKAANADNAKKIADNAAKIDTLNNQMSGVEDSGLKAQLSGLKAQLTAEIAKNSDAIDSLSPKLTVTHHSYKDSLYSVVHIPRNGVKTVGVRVMPMETRASGFKTWVAEHPNSLLFNGPLLRTDRAMYVVNGVAVQPYSSTNETGWGEFGFDAENNPVYIADPTTSNSGADLIAKGIYNGGLVFSAIRLKGANVPVDTIPDSGVKQKIVYGKHPRTLFGWDDNTYYVVIVQGRTPASPGMTYAEMQDAMTTIPNLVNLDGGGNSQCYAQSSDNLQYYAKSSQTLREGTATTGFIFDF